MKKLDIKIVTVLGANGTMGRNVAGIFASFGQAKVYLMCRTKEKAIQAVDKAIESVRCDSIEGRLIPVTYEDIKKYISKSDLVFESLSEDIRIKTEMYKTIMPYLKKGAIVATGTSGLSIKQLSKEFVNTSIYFYGVHMFNPPYHLTLCELINVDNKDSKPLEAYLNNTLKRTTIKVNDEPSFLANRIGFFVINKAMKLAEEFRNKGGIEYIDTIMGRYTGRSMAPLKTANFVGLDIHKSIVDYIYKNSNDEFKEEFKAPNYLNSLVKENKLGVKKNEGLYKTDKTLNKKYVYDIKTNSYKELKNYHFDYSDKMINLIKTGNYKDAFDMLFIDKSLEASICRKLLLEYVSFSLIISKHVSDSIVSCDDAMATGFSWIPPISFIELIGGKKVFLELVYKHLDSKYTKEIDKLYDEIPNKSKYDYRGFLKGKY